MSFLRKILSRGKTEYTFFLSMPWNMRVLLVTNMIYAFVLPVIEVFVSAYILRSLGDVKMVALYQVMVFTGIPITFYLNGYLLNHFKVASLYSFGMLLSGFSMSLMMTIRDLSTVGIVISGLLMGISYGFFWANRDFLALNTTNDTNRNYYYGLLNLPEENGVKKNNY